MAASNYLCLTCHTRFEESEPIHCPQCRGRFLKELRIAEKSLLHRRGLEKKQR
jgi:DNA-directed RNA polymerase subunit RPC12/RpoP